LNNTPIIGVDIMKAMSILKISPHSPCEADKCKGDGLQILGLGWAFIFHNFAIHSFPIYQPFKILFWSTNHANISLQILALKVTQPVPAHANLFRSRSVFPKELGRALLRWDEQSTWASIQSSLTAGAASWALPNKSLAHSVDCS
jgi:hypothetical protein